MSSYLTGLMRLCCQDKNLLSIEEQKYYEFNNALPDYVLISLVDMGVNDEEITDATGYLYQLSQIR